MGLLSLGHHVGHGHHGRAASHHHQQHGHPRIQPHGARGRLSRAALGLLSPRTVFSLLLGIGLTGRLAGSLLAGVPLALAAVAGGLLFELLLVGPLWNFLLRFASQPALTLESAVTDHATAVTGFDREGQGLVAAEANADADAIKIRRLAEATAESIQRVNQAISAGGESYFRYRQIELLPQIAPAIAEALSDARLVTIAGGDAGAPQVAAGNINAVIQTVLAAQLVSRTGLIDGAAGRNEMGQRPEGVNRQS